MDAVYENSAPTSKRTGKEGKASTKGKKEGLDNLPIEHWMEIGLGHLCLPPDQFWSMTLFELVVASRKLRKQENPSGDGKKEVDGANFEEKSRKTFKIVRIKPPAKKK